MVETEEERLVEQPVAHCLCVMLRDQRGWGGVDPPVVVFHHSRNRSGEGAQKILKKFEPGMRSRPWQLSFQGRLFVGLLALALRSLPGLKTGSTNVCHRKEFLHRSGRLALTGQFIALTLHEFYFSTRRSAVDVLSGTVHASPSRGAGETHSAGT